jgi:AcrR family transcriptional regulator
MRQIADRAGIALGGIYNHFSGKEDIFKQIIIHYHPISDILPKLEVIRGKDAPEIVHYAAYTIQETLQDRGDYINLLFAELVEFQGQHINTIFEEIFPRVVAAARNLLDTRDLRSNNLPLMFMIFLAVMFGFFIINRFINQRFLGKFIQLDLDQALDLLLYGMVNTQTGGRS